MLRRLRGLVAVGVFLILGAGCWTAFEEGGRHSLPPAPPGTTDFSDYQPIHPFESLESGIAERSVFTTSDQERYAVEVRDFLVPPAKPETDLHLHGAAVLEVRSGAGMATAGGRELELSQGTVFTADEGERVRITASGGPMVLRTWIVSSRRGS